MNRRNAATHDEHGKTLDWESQVRLAFPDLKDVERAIVMRALRPGDATFWMKDSSQRAYREGILYAVQMLHPRRGALIDEAVWWARRRFLNEAARTLTVERES